MSTVCDSRGPRIGSEGPPRCRLPIGHSGAHRPSYEDGWGYTLTWSDFTPTRSAPELSAEERATVERFDAAPAAPESLRERVARALWAVTYGSGWNWDADLPEPIRDQYRKQADAAIAVMRGPSC